MAEPTTITTSRVAHCQKHASAPRPRFRPRMGESGNVTLPGGRHKTRLCRAELASESPEAGDDPVNGSDPSGLWGWNPISDVVESVKDQVSVFNDVRHGAAAAGDWVASHPQVAIGIGLGVLAVATGGVGLAADVAFEGTLLTTTVADATAVGSGLGAAALDYGPCRSGDKAACVGAGLGFAGAALGAPAIFGDLLGVEADTLPFATLKGLSALGLGIGAGGFIVDLALAGFENQSKCS